MLRLLDLDDRFFEDMLAEAKRSIPHLLPEWTDTGEHDPGITILEMLTWLLEMQQYYADQIPERNEWMFLKLLGIQRRPARPARTTVAFSGVRAPLFIPATTCFRALQTPFETEMGGWLLPTVLEKVMVRTGADTNDYTLSNTNGVPYFAFGKDVENQNALYLGFDQAFPFDLEFSLGLKLYDGYPISLSVYPNANWEAPAQLSWAYYGKKEGESEAGWHPIQLVEDGTHAFTHSGIIRMSVAGYMHPLLLNPANDRIRFWIRCMVEETQYELSPKIETVLVNVLPVRQQETVSESYEFAIKPDEPIEFSSFLAYEGIVSLQIQYGDGWIDWGYFTLEKQPDTYSVRLTVHPDKTSGIALGSSVRVIAYSFSYQPHIVLGQSSGLPNQVFRFEHAPVQGELVLQIGTEQPDGKMIWHDWNRVKSLHDSSAKSRHFYLDEEEAEIYFGNHEQGAIPPKASVPNIRLLRCQIGGGEAGNIKSDLLTESAGKSEIWTRMVLNNPADARGGADQETLAEACDRMRREWRNDCSAITDQDYERLAQQTPGTRIARVKAIPFYAPDSRSTMNVNRPGHTSVVVVPYNESVTPLPSPGTLRTVRRHLEQYRLLGTQLHVIPPVYIEVTVHASILVSSAFSEEKEGVVQALLDFLHPLPRPRGGSGWPFGRTVYKGELYGVMNRIPGVVFIQELWMDAQGENIRRNSSGDIEIPPHGLVYSGPHTIEILRQPDL